MKTVLVTAACAALVSLSLGASPASAQEAPGLSEADREAIVSAVVRHFREHPDQIVEAIMGWRARGGVDLISPSDPVTGNPRGDVTIIEFIDMGCAPCRTMSERIDALTTRDGNIRFVHKDYPVSGTDSVYAARSLLRAAYTDGTRSEIAKAISSAKRIDRKTVDEAATNIQGSLTPIISDRINQTLERTRHLAEKLGIKQLPAIVLMSGNAIDVINGLKTEAEIAASVETLRKKRQND